MTTEDEMLTITEAAKELGYSRTFVYTLIERGELKVRRDPVKRARSVAIPRSEVEALKRRRE